jgi:hypothetical protein
MIINMLVIVKPPRQSSATRGNAHGAWRFAHSVNRITRFAPCALRFAHSINRITRFAPCALRFAHSINRITRFAPCALRFALIPLQKLLIKAVMVCSLKES